MKSTDQVTEAFTELAPRYGRVLNAELKRFWGWSYAGFLNHLVKSLPLTGNDVILDVATGTANIPSLLESSGLSRNHIHGLDITFMMLKYARQYLTQQDPGIPSLTCGSAMVMPYKDESFTCIICGLATHHMQVKDLLSESRRVLKDGGMLSIADAGSSLFWKLPGARFLLKIAAYLYFTLVENKTRAWAEVNAVANIYSKADWQKLLVESGFNDIKIETLSSRYFFIPSPLLIQAHKIDGGLAHG